MFPIILFIISLVLIGCFVFFKNRSKYWEKRGVPYIEPTFPLGNVGDLRKKCHNSELFQKFYNELKGKALFGGLFSLFLQPVILLTDTQFIKTIIIKDFNYFVNRPFYYNEKDDPLSAHLIAIEDDKWRHVRSKLTPTFTSGKMKHMFPNIVNVSEKLINCVARDFNKSNEIDLKDIFARYTIDVIGTCAFGIECNSLTDPNAKFCEMGLRVFTPPRLSAFKRFLVAEFPRFSVFCKIKVFYEEVTDFFLNAVKDTVKYREDNQIKRNDFMSQLIHLRKTEQDPSGFTIEEIAAQCFVFFLAGFETSSSTMTFTLYELALNPDVQEKARTEVNEILAKHNGNFTYEAMCEMKYLDQVVSESLRKYPTGSVVLRKATSNYNVPNSNIVIEKGQILFIPVYAIHNDPDFYPNPEVFDPDRFSEENIRKRKEFCYFPFGGGPRTCIGERFGLMQIRVGIATLLRNFKFSKTSNTEIPMKFSKATITLAPESKTMIAAERI